MRNQISIALAVLAATGIVGQVVAAGLLVPPSQPVSSLEALAREDGVQVVWQADPDTSLIAYRLDRAAAKGAGFEPVSGLAFVPMPWPDTSVRFSVCDSAANSRSIVTYRLMAMRRDGTEAEVGRFEDIPRAQTGGGTMKAVASVEAPRSEPASPPVALAAFPGERVKIAIDRTGLYGVNAAALAACLANVTAEDVSTAIASGGVRMWTGTNEVAWMPAPGDTGVWFFAASRDSIYTTNTFYWLELGAGLVMDTRPATPPGGAPRETATFPETLHFEIDSPNCYNARVFRQPESDVWFWVGLGVAFSSTQAQFSMTIPGIDSNSPARIGVRLNALLETPNSPENHARCYVNGSLAATLDWDGFASYTPSFAVSNLVDGSNAVVIQAFQWGGEPYVMPYYIDSFDADYSRLYRAVNDTLLCWAGTNDDVWIAGFGTTNVWVFDTTDPLRVVRLTSPSVVWTNEAASVGFGSDGAGCRHLVTAAPREPIAMWGRPRTSWSAVTNRADYVVVAPAALREGAEALAAYRGGRGLLPVVVDTEDLYDEFAGGVPSPHAIRGFIAQAWRHWSMAPRYVALVGTGTFNYRSIPGQTGQPCHIPPLQVTTSYGLYGSDTPLGDVDGDHVPEVAVGRLPVATSNDLAAVLLKMQVYEAAATNARTVTLQADDYRLDDPNGPFDFPSCSEGLVPWVPGTYTLERNYLTNGMANQEFRDRFLAALGAGSGAMTYVGHANSTSWEGAGSLMRLVDLPLATNPVAPPLLAMACNVTQFDPPAITSEGLALRLVRKDGGGLAAVWGRVSAGLNEDNVRLGGWLIRAMFRKNGVLIGDAMRNALAGYARDNGARAEVMDTFTLLGDPALDMGIWTGEPRTYAEWKAQVFNAEQQADPDVSGEDKDPDQDGADNMTEFMSGTGPLADDARLAITETRLSGDGGREIRWRSASNRLYTVESATNLTMPFEALQRGLWAECPTNTLVDPREQGMAPVFYRVRLED